MKLFGTPQTCIGCGTTRCKSALKFSKEITMDSRNHRLQVRAEAKHVTRFNHENMECEGKRAKGGMNDGDHRVKHGVKKRKDW